MKHVHLSLKSILLKNIIIKQISSLYLWIFGIRDKREAIVFVTKVFNFTTKITFQLQIYCNNNNKLTILTNLLSILQSSFFKNVSTLFIGTVVAQAINVFGLLILSRLYGTHEFAILALFSAIGSIILSFSTFKLDLAIVKNIDINERAALLKTALQSNFYISIIASIGLFIWAQFDLQMNLEFVFAILVYLITCGASQSLIYFFNSEKNYQPIAISKVLVALINLLIAIMLWYLIPSLGLIIAISLANVVSCLYLVFLFRKKISNLFQINRAKQIEVSKQNKDFIKYSTPTGLLDVLSIQIIIIFLSKAFTEEITGSYFMALKIVMLPTALIGAAISQVFYKEIADKYANKILTKLDFWKIWKGLFLLGIIPFTLLFLFGKNIFEFVLGEEWILAGEIAAILSIKGLLTFISSPTSSGFIVLNQQQTTFWLIVLRISYTFGLLIWSIYHQDIFLFLWCYVGFEFLMILLYNGLILKYLRMQKK